ATACRTRVVDVPRRNAQGQACGGRPRRRPEHRARLVFGGHCVSECIDEAWFSDRAQPGVRALRAYDPGHDLVALRRRFADAQLVELGSNENPYGASPAVRAAVLDTLHALHRYPDPRGGDLKRAL